MLQIAIIYNLDEEKESAEDIREMIEDKFRDDYLDIITEFIILRKE